MNGEFVTLSRLVNGKGVIHAHELFEIFHL